MDHHPLKKHTHTRTPLATHPTASWRGGGERNSVTTTTTTATTPPPSLPRCVRDLGCSARARARRGAHRRGHFQHVHQAFTGAACPSARLPPRHHSHPKLPDTRLLPFHLPFSLPTLPQPLPQAPYHPQQDTKPRCITQAHSHTRQGTWGQNTLLVTCCSQP
ncbi:hypothetical protein E2C01_089933 [Portunus trituberculatus]|uniref:Uncharacterized protein n=1 Tax=Portunus trituberculatus TaxID=210409 RepID=A0A5B7JIX8_PORTR|nr:hypothetical protein [Portunus trituberculatus]